MVMWHNRVRCGQRGKPPIRRRQWFSLVGLALCALVSSGCHTSVATPPAPPKPPEVMVAHPLAEDVIEYEEVTGRTWATDTIEVRSRVSGYLDKVYFRDGAEVKAGEILFEIDPRPFRAELEKASATVKQAEAHLERLVRQEERLKKLLPSKSITMDEYEAITFELQEAKAALESARATESTAILNLNYTRITSRISGVVGRRLIDEGNLVKADDTTLATIVSIDPIHAYFDLDERTYLRFKRLMQEGKVKSPQEVNWPAKVAVADDPNYTIEGSINFIDNQLDGSTGTLRARANIPNKDGLLSPGLFIRMQVPIGEPHKAILVREEALGSDQGQRFVYLIEQAKNDKTGVMEDVVRYRRVTIGMLDRGRRVITEGLTGTERVIVTGLQRVRPGVAVQATLVDKDGKPIKPKEGAATPTVAQDAPKKS